MEQQEIIRFEINNWFSGRDFPPAEPFKTWVRNSQFSNNDWCKENKLVVMYGPIDMSENWLVSAPKEWIEKNCPQLLSDEEFEYSLITHRWNKETGHPENVEMKYKKKFSDFLCFPDEGDEPDDVHGHIADDWTFPEYCEDNFGVQINTSWYDDDIDNEDDDEDDDEE